MPPAVLIDLGFEVRRDPRRVPVIGPVTDRAGCTGSAARAGVLAFPRLVGVVFTHPTAVLATERTSMPFILYALAALPDGHSFSSLPAKNLILRPVPWCK
jgi:hypothetical protein